MAWRLSIAWVGWMLLGAMLVLPVLAWQGDWFAAEHWPIRNLRVESEERHVPIAEIRARVATQIDGGFFGVDLAEVRAAVMANPWVEQVEVRRQFPDRIVLRVDERHPVASFGVDRLLSSRGALFPVAAPYWPEGLPRLDGPDDERARLFNFWESANREFTALGTTVVGARMSERGALALDLDSGCEVVFPRNADARLLARFIRSYAELVPDERLRLARVDLRYANGYVVVWKPAPETDAPATTPVMPPVPEPSMGPEYTPEQEAA